MKGSATTLASLVPYCRPIYVTEILLKALFDYPQLSTVLTGYTLSLHYK